MSNAVVAVMLALFLFVGAAAVVAASADVSHDRADEFDELIEPVFHSISWLPLVLIFGTFVAVVSVFAGLT